MAEPTMTWEIGFTFAVLLGATVLFATEKLRVDLVALLVMSVLMVAGIVSPEEGISGFSNPATVTVAAMFVLSGGLIRTGVVNKISELVTGLMQRRPVVAVGAVMLLIAPISGFINNTAAVAIFVPVVLAAARDSDVSASKVLIPLSFAAIFGGICTLIGTSTNLLVSSIAEGAGLRPFGMFELAPVGLALMALGFVYVLTAGLRILPSRRADREDLTERFGLGEYLTQVELDGDSELVGQRAGESDLVRRLGVDVLKVRREGETVEPRAGLVRLRAGDVLRIRGEADDLRELVQEPGIHLRPREDWRDELVESDDLVLAEVVVLPNSRLDGSTLGRTRFRQVYGGVPLALRHHGETVHEDLSEIRLTAGDTLLLALPEDRVEQLHRKPDFTLVSRKQVYEYREDRMWLALATLAVVVGVVVADLVPISVSAPAGAVFLVLTQVLTPEEAYESIDWKVIFLLAGVLALGAALETTGAAAMLAHWVLSVAGDHGDVILIGAFYLLTSLLTESMSNNASAAVLAPVAIAAAHDLGVDPRPLLMAVTFAASASFMTPVGYQTNLIVYGPGQYRYSDFLKVGTPLNLLFLVLASWLIPRVWPL